MSDIIGIIAAMDSEIAAIKDAMTDKTHETISGIEFVKGTLCGKNAGNFEDSPILIKFIDAMDNLSVQVHPTKEYCELTGKGQSKTECWYIIDCEEDAGLILGFKAIVSRFFRNRNMMRRIQDADDEQIIDFV